MTLVQVSEESSIWKWWGFLRKAPSYGFAVGVLRRMSFKPLTFAFFQLMQKTVLLSSFPAIELTEFLSHPPLMLSRYDTLGQGARTPKEDSHQWCSFTQLIPPNFADRDVHLHHLKRKQRRRRPLYLSHYGWLLQPLISRNLENLYSVSGQKRKLGRIARSSNVVFKL